MNDRVLYNVGGHLQIRDNGKAPVLVAFPVCLAIKYGNDISELCPDFVLNIEESWVFIGTESPLPPGSLLLMHFYIPPETKLLAEVQGKVIPAEASDMQSPRGMLVRFTWFARRKLKRMERYAYGEQHMVDRTA